MSDNSQHESDIAVKACKDCPCAEYQTEHSEMGQNYGCLPCRGEILSAFDNYAHVWACHSNPKIACKGLVKLRNINPKLNPTHGERFGDRFNQPPTGGEL